MPRIAIVNMMIGFAAICLAGAAGAFLANDMALSYVSEGKMPSDWAAVVLASAHGHFNLFGIVQVLYGLTLPYSRLDAKWRRWQNFALLGGLIAMGPGMMARAWVGPSGLMGEAIAAVIGALLSGYLVALVSHVYGLGKYRI